VEITALGTIRETICRDERYLPPFRVRKARDAFKHPHQYPLLGTLQFPLSRAAGDPSYGKIPSPFRGGRNWLVNPGITEVVIPSPPTALYERA